MNQYNIIILINKRIPQDIKEEVLERLTETSHRYLGECSKCGKFFYKERKDQVYCSIKCKNAAASQKYRDKRKTE